ncbi:hypothetical protein PTKIN_Ptkin11bG0180400 [Pterospermum kingtungense]
MKESRVTEQSRFLEEVRSCYPWLVFPHWEDESHQTFSSISRPFNSYVKSSSKSRIKEVLGHSYGWLIISRKTITKPTIRQEFIFLWNPASSKSIKLPPLDLKPDQRISSASLLSPPGNPDSVVLVFEKIVKSFIFCKIGDENWTKIPAKETDAKMQIIDEEPSNRNRSISCCPVNYKGRCYVALRKKLKVIDQVNPKHIMLKSLNCKLPPLNSSSSVLSRKYLVESCGELCFIYITMGGLNSRQVLDIEIFSLDSITMEWSQMKSSKDRAFFFSMNAPYAISCTANELGIEGGFVYYTSGRDKILYSFNIDDRSISICLPGKNFPPLSRPFWFMPDLSIANPETEVKKIISVREVKQGGDKNRTETEKRKGKHILNFLLDKSVENITELPYDIITLIAENLYLVDYMNFRQASKTFGEVAPHIQWREITSFKLQSHSLPPWLMFADKGYSSTVHTFIDPKLGGRYLMNIPEFLIGYDIRYSKDGWLLMSPKVKEESMFFYNPFIKQHISVPPHTGGDPVQSFGFWSSPTSPAGCIIVGISSRSISWFYQSRIEEWSEFVRDDYASFTPTHTCPVYWDESFYFLGQEGNLGALWIEESNNQLFGNWYIYYTPTKPCKSFDQSYLLECGGYLYAVFVDNLGESIQVCLCCDLGGDTWAWHEVRDIGNYMFFVSSSSSFSMVAKTPGMENKIYFPKMKRNKIVYYCLRTGKYRTFGSDQVLSNFYNTTEYLYSSWIQQIWLD